MQHIIFDYIKTFLHICRYTMDLLETIDFFLKFQ